MVRPEEGEKKHTLSGRRVLRRLICTRWTPQLTADAKPAHIKLQSRCMRHENGHRRMLIVTIHPLRALSKTTALLTMVLAPSHPLVRRFPLRSVLFPPSTTFDHPTTSTKASPLLPPISVPRQPTLPLTPKEDLCSPTALTHPLSFP